MRLGKIQVGGPWLRTAGCDVFLVGASVQLEIMKKGNNSVVIPGPHTEFRP